MLYSVVDLFLLLFITIVITFIIIIYFEIYYQVILFDSLLDVHLVNWDIFLLRAIDRPKASLLFVTFGTCSQLTVMQLSFPVISSTLLRFFELCSYFPCQDGDGEDRWLLEIVTPSRNYLLSAANPVEREAWLDVLQVWLINSLNLLFFFGFYWF